MRFHLLGLMLMASVAAPALAQRGDPLDRRVDRLETQLRAVQRRVFPNGQPVEPEIGARPGPVAGDNLSGDALANLSARVDAIEAQLRTLTGQVEESNNRSRQVEDQISRLRAELSARIERIEAPAAASLVESPPAATTASRRQRAAADPPAATIAAPAAEAGPASAEEAYNAGFRLWNEHRYGEAQAALEAAATRYPTGRWISWTRNLQGRAYLDDNKPATAARILLANYQDNPRGERAADSLYYLGQALTRLNRRPEACRVYDELASVYPTMREELRRRIPQARTDARCEGN
jgi:TolA-binding protein